MLWCNRRLKLGHRNNPSEPKRTKRLHDANKRPARGFSMRVLTIACWHRRHRRSSASHTFPLCLCPSRTRNQPLLRQSTAIMVFGQSTANRQSTPQRHVHDARRPDWPPLALSNSCRASATVVGIQPLCKRQFLRFFLFRHFFQVISMGIL